MTVHGKLETLAHEIDQSRMTWEEAVGDLAHFLQKLSWKGPDIDLSGQEKELVDLPTTYANGQEFYSARRRPPTGWQAQDREANFLAKAEFKKLRAFQSAIGGTKRTGPATRWKGKSQND